MRSLFPIISGHEEHEYIAAARRRRLALNTRHACFVNALREARAKNLPAPAESAREKGVAKTASEAGAGN